MSDASNYSRRNFLKATGIVAGVAFGSSVFAATAGAPDAKPHADAHAAGSGDAAVRGRMFFTNDLEFSTLSQAAERIFPKDDIGPGAIELQVPYFIDNQLAGAYGYNAREYMDGPFAQGAPTQGTQTPLLRRDIFLLGLAALNAESQRGFSKNFPEIADDQKDQILKKCETGEIPAEGLSSALFFSVLRSAVLAGAYADPIYGGNSGMNGWKMKKYPGAQMAYVDIIDSDKFEVRDPISLANM